MKNENRFIVALFVFILFAISQSNGQGLTSDVRKLKQKNVQQDRQIRKLSARISELERNAIRQDTDTTTGVIMGDGGTKIISEPPSNVSPVTKVKLKKKR